MATIKYVGKGEKGKVTVGKSYDVLEFLGGGTGAVAALIVDDSGLLYVTRPVTNVKEWQYVPAK